MTELEPVHPITAAELYYEQQLNNNLSPRTVEARERRVRQFTEWCEENNIEALSDLSGRHLLAYKNDIASGIAPATLRTYLSDLRQFLLFCTNIDAVSDSLPEKVSVPVLSDEDNRRETVVEREKIEAMLDYLSRYEYASMHHVLVALAGQTGARMGGLHSLDVRDVDTENARLSFAHRPDEGTRLKNGRNGERVVALDEDCAEMLEVYIEGRRVSKQDQYGRRPLFTTKRATGRLSKAQLHARLYHISLPCQHGQGCPLDKSPETCDWAQVYDEAVKCPESERSHDFRRGVITHLLRESVPIRIVSDRVDADEDTLDQHYDRRTKTEKTEVRRDYLEDI